MDLYFFNLINPVKDSLFFSVKSFDYFIFNGVNQFTLKWSWLDTLGIFFAKYLGYLLILCLLLFLAINFRKYCKMVVLALVSAGISRFVIVGFIRWLWQRPRPFIGNDVNLLLTHNAASFPSGHAAFFFGLSTIVFFHHKKIGILFFIASFLIGLARVFVGIHWPSDILAGVVIGIFSGWLVHKFSNSQ